VRDQPPRLEAAGQRFAGRAPVAVTRRHVEASFAAARREHPARRPRYFPGMVLRGQFLERPTLIPSGKHTLEGLWHRGEREPAALLIPPLPGDGSMDAAALNELAFAFSQAGHPSLRFNFGGVGASQGQSKTLAAQEKDARAALTLLRENAGFEPIFVVGFKSGARV